MSSDFTPAKRGDLVAIVTTERAFYIGQPSTERTRVELAIVRSVSREGVVKAVRYAWDSSPVGKNALPDRGQRTLVIGQDRIDVEAAMAMARAHTWPGHSTVKPFDSIAEATAALRPYLRTSAHATPARPAAITDVPVTGFAELAGVLDQHAADCGWVVERSDRLQEIADGDLRLTPRLRAAIEAAATACALAADTVTLLPGALRADLDV
ncbi:hypothetical protein [Cryptosporangium phraense]|uniref:Uncharacterized protein n=1 Tax=Cryptosporangium phraense TaxID=2593070 RepID=A0A545AR76_9ACTN|nr:hypothetical protein [Cryptosporangium phraense]TQS43741.1 hypothetical protein FL583_17035 [Cryptosporangium phraense]